MRTTIRKFLVLLASPVLATGAIAATTQPAEASSCKISLSGLPTKVTIDSTDKRYWIRATASGCSQLNRSDSDAYADAYGPNTTRKRTYDLIDAGFKKSSHITLGSSDYTAGKYVVRDDGSGIYDNDYDDLHYTWVTKSFVAKYRSYTSLSAKRSGKKVTVHGTVKRYSPDWYEYVPHKRPVKVQRYTAGAWHTIKTVTSSGGRYSYSTKTSKHYKYRAVIAETAKALGSTSGTHSA